MWKYLGACFALGVVACASESTVENDDALSSACTAKISYLQKDAYKDLGGPLTPGWPPHTTTQLTVKCNGAAEQVVAMVNHSDVQPGQKDKNGVAILVEVHSETVTGSAANMKKLIEAYKSCECKADTFFSLGKLESGPAAELYKTLKGILETDVTCTGTGKQDLMAALTAQDAQKATEAWKKCTIPEAKAQSAFEKGLLAAEQAQAIDLSGYHVCNNDAKLQAKLVRDFKSTNRVNACDANSTMCKGPAFFYTPKTQ